MSTIVTRRISTRHSKAAMSMLLVFAVSAMGDNKKTTAKSAAPAKTAPATTKPGGTGTSKPDTNSATTKGQTGGDKGTPITKQSPHRPITTSPTTPVRPEPSRQSKSPRPPTPTPKGQKTTQAKNGASVTTRADGRVATLHDPKRGMDVHHGLNGGRRVEVERVDHSRVVAERGGRGYVQRPITFHDHEYARRSFYYHGRYYHAYYGRYYYRGVYVYPYYPAYYYPPAYYGWVYNPWAVSVAYSWGWAGNPWYAYYGPWFAPYPTYAGPAFWLTDYLIATSLSDAYQARLAAQAQADAAAQASGAAPLSPDVKQAIADEVRRQIALENNEAQGAAANPEPNPASSGIQRSLTDGLQHVFVAGSDLDVTDAAGNECALSEGDALQLIVPTAPDATSVNLTVLASKGGKECARADTVAVSVQDLQEMQNHMRQTIDQGMAELQKKQGQGGLPAPPSSAQGAPVETPMAAIAPPPPPQQDVASEINQQSQAADKAEQEAGAGSSGTAGASGSR